MTDTNTPQEKIRQELTLEEAIQIYQDSDTSEKRLGVTKDGIATVDLVHFQNGEQHFSRITKNWKVSGQTLWWRRRWSGSINNSISRILG